MSDSVVDSKAEVKQATKYVKETENVAEKYSAMTVSKNSSDVNMNVGEMPSAAFTAVPTLKSVKKVRSVMLAISQRHRAQRPGALQAGIRAVLQWSAAAQQGQPVHYYYSQGTVTIHRAPSAFSALQVDSREVNDGDALVDVVMRRHA